MHLGWKIDKIRMKNQWHERTEKDMLEKSENNKELTSTQGRTGAAKSLSSTLFLWRTLFISVPFLLIPPSIMCMRCRALFFMAGVRRTTPLCVWKLGEVITSFPALGHTWGRQMRV
jgi:hypothetical protein